MSLLVVLGVVAVAQVVFVAMRRAARVQGARARAGTPLAEWLVGTGSALRLAEALRTLPGDAALAFATELRDLRIPVSMRTSFAAALRHEPWVVRALTGVDSHRWWNRLDARTRHRRHRR